MAPRSLLAVLLLSLICASTAYVAIDSQYVLGVAIEDSARAYPLEVLNYHEIVNDEYKNVSFAVTWAPLTGSNVVLLTQPLYSRNKQMGSSGNLYQNNLVLYDRATRSLWAQMSRQPIDGVLEGGTLDFLFSTITRWSTWKRMYPHTKVLSRPTGSRRNYWVDPYKHYRKEDRIMFQSCFIDHYAEPPYSIKRSKERTLIAYTESQKIVMYPYSELAGYPVVNTRYYETGERILVTYDEENSLVMTFSPYINESLLIFDLLKPSLLDPTLDYTNISRGLMMFIDTNTGSIWNMLGEAIDGPLAGVKLNTLPSFTAFWFAAVSFFPNEYIYLDYKIHKIPPAVQCPAPPNATDTCAVPCSEIIAAGPDADTILSIDSPIWIGIDQFEQLERTPWYLLMPYLSTAGGLFGLFLALYSFNSCPKKAQPTVNLRRNLTQDSMAKLRQVKDDDED